MPMCADVSTARVSTTLPTDLQKRRKGASVLAEKRKDVKGKEGKKKKRKEKKARRSKTLDVTECGKEQKKACARPPFEFLTS